MKVLLLGGTGVMGTALSEELQKNRIEVYITTRSFRKSRRSEHYIQGNAMDVSFLETVCGLHYWDAVVDFMSYKTEQFRERVEMLLNATKQYVYISTGRVYGHNEYPIKESSPKLLDISNDIEYLKTDEYALTKARQENILLQSGRKNYTIVRPCIIYGDERLQLGVLEKEEWLYRALHGREIVFCKEILDKTTTMTNGKDVASAFIKIIGNNQCLGETYHITCNHHRTWEQIFNIYRSAIKNICGKEIKLKIVSLKDFIDSRPEFLKYQVIYDRVYDKIFDTHKESTIINVDAFISPEEGLYNAISNFVTYKKQFRNISVEYEAKRDKLTHEYSTFWDILGWKSKIKYIIYRFIK